jgi:hypothetical protein
MRCSASPVVQKHCPGLALVPEGFEICYAKILEVAQEVGARPGIPSTYSRDLQTRDEPIHSLAARTTEQPFPIETGQTHMSGVSPPQG